MARSSSFSFLLLALCCSFACASAETVWDVVNTNALFTNLKARISASLVDPEVLALQQRLNSSANTTTFFAPTNAAIEATGPNLTAAFLSYYLVNGNLNVSTLRNGQLLGTLWNVSTLDNNPQKVKVTNNAGTYFVQTSPIGQSFAVANGVVYAINLNLTVPDTVLNILAKSQFEQYVVLAKANAQFKANNLTVFPPSDAAFQALPAFVSSFLGKNISSSNALLTKILTYHLVSTQVFYVDGQTGTTTLTSVEGGALNVVISGSNVTVNDSTVQQPADVLAANGVVHNINKVLLPLDLNFTYGDALIGLNAASYLAALQKNPPVYSILTSNSKGYMVFAPATISVNATEATLNYTIVSGVQALSDGLILATNWVSPGNLNGTGQRIKITGSATTGFSVNGQPIQSTTNLPVSNGVIYGIPEVVEPVGPAATVINQWTVFSKALQLVPAVKSLLEGAGDITLFAPVDSVFAGMPAVAGYLMLNTTASNAQLAQVLNYHIYNASAIFSATIISGYNQNLVMQNEEVANVVGTTVNGTLHRTVNGSLIVSVDTLASNGVVHGLDGILLPKTLTINSTDLLRGLGDTTLLALINATQAEWGNFKFTNCTIFAPSNAAFSNLADQGLLSYSTAEQRAALVKLLSAHIVGEPVGGLVNGTKLTSIAPANASLLISSNDGKTFTVNIVGAQTPAGNVLSVAHTYGVTPESYVYGIDQVLGAQNQQQGGDGGGLSSTAVGLIVAGCIVGVLLAGAAIAAGVWYYKRRSEYETIDGDTY